MHRRPLARAVTMHPQRHKAAGNAGDDTVREFATEKPLSQRMLEYFVSVYTHKASQYSDRDEAKFRYYAEKAVQAAKELAPYRSRSSWPWQEAMIAKCTCVSPAVYRSTMIRYGRCQGQRLCRNRPAG
jgi:hypothetical protein